MAAPLEPSAMEMIRKASQKARTSQNAVNEMGYREETQ